jgi:hypothetical protein
MNKKLEKRIVNILLENEFVDLKLFYKDIFILKENPAVKDRFLDGYYNLLPNIRVPTIKKSEKNNILEYSIKLINYLDMLTVDGSINSYYKEDSHFLLFIKDQKSKETQPEGFPEFHKLMRQHNQKIYIKTKDLKTYKRWGYRTKENRKTIITYIELLFTVLLLFNGIFSIRECSPNKEIEKPIEIIETIEKSKINNSINKNNNKGKVNKNNKVKQPPIK